MFLQTRRKLSNHRCAILVQQFKQPGFFRWRLRCWLLVLHLAFGKPANFVLPFLMTLSTRFLGKGFIQFFWVFEVMVGVCPILLGFRCSRTPSPSVRRLRRCRAIDWSRLATGCRQSFSAFFWRSTFAIICSRSRSGALITLSLGVSVMNSMHSLKSSFGGSRCWSVCDALLRMGSANAT